MARSYVLSVWGAPILIGICAVSAPVRAQNICVPVQSQSQVSYMPQASCALQVSYMPQVSYRTVWRQVPVTTYRPVTYTNLLGVQTTYLQQVRAMQWQAQQEGYTTYRPVYSTDYAQANAANVPPPNSYMAVETVRGNKDMEAEISQLRKHVLNIYAELDRIKQQGSTTPSIR